MIPLHPARWEYDPVTNRIVLTFVEVPPADHPDPVNFVSSRDYQIEILPRAVDTQDVVQPEQPQIDQLTEVVDQLLLNDLMKDMMMEGLL